MYLKSIQTIRNAVVFGLAVAALAANAQSRIVLNPVSPRPYEPMAVNVTFSKPYCLSDVYPLIGEVTYENKTLSIVLSHLKVGACKTTYVFNSPGLPAGVQTIAVIVSARAPDPSSPAIVAEKVTLTTTIGQETDAYQDKFLWTGRIDGDGFFNPFNVPPGTQDGPIVPYALHGEPVTIRGDWLEIGNSFADIYTSAYTFKVLSYPTLRIHSPQSAVTPLYSVSYPEPLRGLFYTANLSVYNRLVREWKRGNEIAADTPSGIFVGKLVDGTCPLGMTPVYQAFHPQAIAHRYTQNAVAYRTLIANGYVGDGPQWCSPAR